MAKKKMIRKPTGFIRKVVDSDSNSDIDMQGGPPKDDEKNKDDDDDGMLIEGQNLDDEKLVLGGGKGKKKAGFTDDVDVDGALDKSEKDEEKKRKQ